MTRADAKTKVLPIVQNWCSPVYIERETRADKFCRLIIMVHYGVMLSCAFWLAARLLFHL